MYLKYATVAMMAIGQAIAMPGKLVNRSPEPEFEDGKYIVDRQAGFANRATWNFNGNSLPSGLSISSYSAGGRVYSADNVVVRNGYLELRVPGGQRSLPYRSAEIVTNVQNIKYASVRTRAIFSETPGVCNGIFFYKADNQETDIEWLSDPNSLSNGGTRKLWLTNQDRDGDGRSTHLAANPPSNPTTTEHEYRLDWTAGRVRWYVDGVQVFETTRDVPDVAGPWIWNNWSNGDRGWSAGPPAQDAVFRIRSIDMYYNTE